MRSRYLVLLAVVVALGLVAGVVLAQNRGGERGRMGGGDMMGGMGQGGMMAGGQGRAGCPMGQMMSRASMVASGDFIYVLNGNRLLQYTRGLNLVKEVEIPMDMAGMHRMMESCPMMQGEARSAPRGR